MAASASTTTLGALNRPLTLPIGSSATATSGASASFPGRKARSSRARESKIWCERSLKGVAEVDEMKQSDGDRWRGLATDVSDDQQDITRGKGMVDTLFQAPAGAGTHDAVLSSYEYLSAGLRQ